MGTRQLNVGAPALTYSGREFVPKFSAPPGPWSGAAGEAERQRRAARRAGLPPSEHREKPNSFQGNMGTSGRFSNTV